MGEVRSAIAANAWMVTRRSISGGLSAAGLGFCRAADLLRPNRLPDALGSSRELHVIDTKTGQCIDDGIHNRRRSSNVASLATALHTEQICFRWYQRVFACHVRDVLGARHTVVHERASHELY